MSQRRTAYEIVEAVLTRLGPKELPYLPQLWAVYVKDPTDSERSRERLMGSGILTEVTAWAPVVISFVGGAVLDAAKDELSDQTRAGIRGLVGRVARRGKAQIVEEPLPPFDDLQRRRIGESVLSRALAMGLPRPRAQLLADAVVGELQRDPRPDEPEG
ncbi:hypothetical protein [Streptosporangium saharense]|uniref:Uncharacterized protein n=1 Tax=Streptosporangium saharense TaxID=1706840 RepID=A0A7W7QPL2_9ACTN|nr:hypothetical protein [Streptosporangium saharense]MBB4917387.1 hypothetical protein [Streptosporangium saharense]